MVKKLGLGNAVMVDPWKPRKSRAKKTETTPRKVGKHPALAMPYGRTVYKTPGVSWSVREGLLGSTSGPDRLLAPIMPHEAHAIGLATGRWLGIIADKYDPATRTRRPYIVRP